jgi:mannose-6-phosphate isomerase-like protein (cupin superfamily)
MKSILTSLALLVLLAWRAVGADGANSIRHRDERDGAATIIHRASVVPDRATNASPRGGLWPLYSTPEARLNYFEVAGRTSLHFHPDAEHRLYVLEGKVLVTCGTNTTTAVVGDFIVIPRGVRHCYDVPAKGDRALLLTFDAPPFDPRKTVNIETPQR